MASLASVVTFLDSWLGTEKIRDYSYNGLQVEGSAQVKRIMCAVDAGKAVFEEAVARGADMVFVHHGHFWKHADPRLTGWRRERLDVLLKNNISLYASHLPLDLHPVSGNNALLLAVAGCTITGPFGQYEGQTISYTGKLSRSVSFDDFASRICSRLGVPCTLLPFGKKRVSTVAVLSGGGGYDHFAEAVKQGVDVYITGESRDFFHDAADSGMNVIFGGHHATETLGPKAIATLLQKKLGVSAEFVDIPTGL